MTCHLRQALTIEPPLFDARLLHGLDISASDFCAEEDYYRDVFRKYRGYSGNTKRDKSSLMRARDAFVLNMQQIGRDVSLLKLNTAHVRFEKRTLNKVKFDASLFS